MELGLSIPCMARGMTRYEGKTISSKKSVPPTQGMTRSQTP
jgi:hypothetical protein